VSQSQEDSNYIGATQLVQCNNTHQFRKRLNRCNPVQCNNTHQFRKRLNRCYQFNATVLVSFLFWGPIILMEKISMDPFPTPQVKM
jgi:hypothetical protein